MIGTEYWATGITVRWRAHAGTKLGVPHSGWGASLEFRDDGFCDDDVDAGMVSTEGVLRTRYYLDSGVETTGLRAAVDTIRADAARMGITFAVEAGVPCLYVDESDDADALPEGWVDLLLAEAERIGFVCPFALAAHAKGLAR